MGLFNRAIATIPKVIRYIAIYITPIIIGILTIANYERDLTPTNPPIYRIVKNKYCWCWSDSFEIKYLGYGHCKKIEKSLKDYCRKKYHKTYYLMPGDSIWFFLRGNAKVVEIIYYSRSLGETVKIRPNNTNYFNFTYAVDFIRLSSKKSPEHPSDSSKIIIQHDTVYLKNIRLSKVGKGNTLSRILARKCNSDQNRITESMQKKGIKVNKIFSIDKYGYRYNDRGELILFIYCHYSKKHTEWYCWYRTIDGNPRDLRIRQKPSYIIR